jgi:CheY-like chemotaxis protein
VLDFKLPDGDGLQVVEQLRAHPRTKTVPILISTGQDLTASEHQQLAGQVQSISSKTAPQHLLAELDRLGTKRSKPLLTPAIL